MFLLQYTVVLVILVGTFVWLSVWVVVGNGDVFSYVIWGQSLLMLLNVVNAMNELMFSNRWKSDKQTRPKTGYAHISSERYKPTVQNCTVIGMVILCSLSEFIVSIASTTISSDDVEHHIAIDNGHYLSVIKRSNECPCGAYGYCCASWRIVIRMSYDHGLLHNTRRGRTVNRLIHCTTDPNA